MSFEVVKKYVKFTVTVDFCWVDERFDLVNLAEYRSTVKHAERKLDKLGSISLNLKEMTRRSLNLDRRRASPFGFVGIISHTLFETLDVDDGKYYLHKFSQLEE